jgi:hypothetical protein
MAGIIKVDRVQSDSNLAFNVGGSNVSFFNSTGVNIVGGEIIAGGSTLRTTGGLLYANNGISFPAAVNASADPNTLDDYEEGTFTPAISYETPGTLSITSTERFGTYVKIGRVVYFTIDYRISAFSKGTASGDLLLAGLPFAQRSTSGYDNARITIQLYNWEFTSSPFIGIMVPSGTGLALSRMVSNSASVALNDPRGGSIVWATGFYFV